MLKLDRRHAVMLASGLLATAITGAAVGAEAVVRTPLPEGDSPLPTVQELEELLGIEQAGNSNGHSSSPQPFGRVEQTEFECSNENEGYEV